MLWWLFPKPQLWVRWDLSLLYLSLSHSLCTVFSNLPQGELFSFHLAMAFPLGLHLFCAKQWQIMNKCSVRCMLDWNLSPALSLVPSALRCKMKTVSSVDRNMLEKSEQGTCGKIPCVPVFLRVQSVQRRCEGEVGGWKVSWESCRAKPELDHISLKFKFFIATKYQVYDKSVTLGQSHVLNNSGVFSPLSDIFPSQLC